MLDWRPVGVRPSVLARRLVLRPGVEGMRLELELVRGLGAGTMLVRRLFINTLVGRAARRAMGLSSMAVLSPSSSAMEAWRAEAGVEERGVERMGSLPFAGVVGDFIGLANGRFDCCGVVEAGRLGVCCMGVVDAGRRCGWCEGVVEAGRMEGDGDRAERLKGLRTGSEDWLDKRLIDRGDSFPLLYGEGVVSDNGLKLWPTTVSRMFTLEFQRGLTAGLSDLGVMERVGVAVRAREGAVP
jgi:hypothetical protein